MSDVSEIEKIESLKSEIRSRTRVIKSMQEGLPHIYGMPWYRWARKFYESRNQVNLLCAANQISKSSTQIRKCIEWATNDKLWPKLWGKKPNQFWYLYPSKDVATIEFEKKWIPEWMPRGDFVNHHKYGWKANYEKQKISSVDFNTGVTVYFKTYAQDVITLQSGSCYAIFCDEELPEELFDELMFRIAAVGGYFHMVFTATLNQEFWQRAIEPKERGTENLPSALKQQISMYDCMTYEDGSPSPWTQEKIKEIESRCKNKTEVLRRVYGRFVTEQNRIIHAYDPTRHYIPRVSIPKDWILYSGVDLGSGGKDNHPSAIAFIAVRPDFCKGYVFKCWRGDGIQTASGDVILKHQEMEKELADRKLTAKKYDHAASDFGTINERMGLGFTKAEKSHTVGEDIVNTLFKYDMLFILEGDEENKLSSELSTIMHSTPKTKRKDDLADAVRYGVVEIPWNFPAISLTSQERDDALEGLKKETRPLTEKEYNAWQIRMRRGEEDILDEEEEARISDKDPEIEFWNEQY